MADNAEDANMEPVEMTPIDNGAYISERFRDPGAATKAAAPSGNYTLAGIFAIIALLAFIIMLAFLYYDWADLNIA